MEKHKIREQGSKRSEAFGAYFVQSRFGFGFHKNRMKEVGEEREGREKEKRSQKGEENRGKMVLSKRPATQPFLSTSVL